MANKKEKAKAELKYQKEARYLAMSYTKLLEERDRLQKRIDGDWTYTKEMAIAELSSITDSFDNERVQTSNIDNPTERIAIKLTDEFMKRRQAEMHDERDACIRKREYIDWKIEVVETVWKERSNKTQKVIFQLLFYQHKTFCETKEIMRKRRNMILYDWGLVVIKEQIWQLFSIELDFCMNAGDGQYVRMLVEEVNAQPEGATDGKSKGETCKEKT